MLEDCCKNAVDMRPECGRNAQAGCRNISQNNTKTDQEGAKWKEQRIHKEPKGSEREAKGSKIDFEAVVSIPQESWGDVWAVGGRS